MIVDCRLPTVHPSVLCDLCRPLQCCTRCKKRLQPHLFDTKDNGQCLMRATKKYTKKYALNKAVTEVDVPVKEAHDMVKFVSTQAHEIRLVIIDELHKWK